MCAVLNIMMVHVALCCNVRIRGINNTSRPHHKYRLTPPGWDSLKLSNVGHLVVHRSASAICWQFCSKTVNEHSITTRATDEDLHFKVNFFSATLLGLYICHLIGLPGFRLLATVSVVLTGPDADL